MSGPVDYLDVAPCPFMPLQIRDEQLLQLRYEGSFGSAKDVLLIAESPVTSSNEGE